MIGIRCFTKLFVATSLSLIMLTAANAQKHTVWQKNIDTIPQTTLDTFFKYLSKTIKYPWSARDSWITGIVLITFKVDPNNKIYATQVIRSPWPEMSEEVMKVLENSSVPSLKKKDIIYALPLYFTLDNIAISRNVEKYHAPVHDEELSKLLGTPVLLYSETIIKSKKVWHRHSRSETSH